MIRRKDEPISWIVRKKWLRSEGVDDGAEVVLEKVDIVNMVSDIDFGLLTVS